MRFFHFGLRNASHWAEESLTRLLMAKPSQHIKTRTTIFLREVDTISLVRTDFPYSTEPANPATHGKRAVRT